MPYIETVDELADHIADKCGVYGAHGEGEDVRCTEKSPCRMCFVSDLTERIRASVRNEKLLSVDPAGAAGPEPRQEPAKPKPALPAKLLASPKLRSYGLSLPNRGLRGKRGGF